MHTNAPTAPSIPAIEPTCGYTTARMKGPTRMPKLSIMLILFDDASGLPVASSNMFDLRHAKIKEQVAVSQKNEHMRINTAGIDFVEYILRKFQPISTLSDVRSIESLNVSLLEKPMAPRIPQKMQDMQTTKNPRKMSRTLFFGFLLFLYIGKLILCKQNPPPRIPIR